MSRRARHLRLLRSRRQQQSRGTGPQACRIHPDDSSVEWSQSSAQDFTTSPDEEEWPSIDFPEGQFVGTPQAESSGEVQVATIDACRSSSSSPFVQSPLVTASGEPLAVVSVVYRACVVPFIAALSPHSSLSSLLSLEPPEEFRDRSPSQSPTDTPEVVEAVDPIAQLVPAILQQLRQHPLESVDSIADRVASRTVTFSRAGSRTFRVVRHRR
jgi:hypothetical protein